MKDKSQACEEKILGIDLHPDSFSLAVTVPKADGTLNIQQQITKAPTSEWREHLLKISKPALVVCEASGNSFEFMKTAEELGFRTCILNSVDVGQLGKKLCKTDKQDAVRIVKIYQANLASEVWLPDEETRKLRAVSSMFDQASQDCRRINNRIKSFLTQYDVRLGKGEKDLSSPIVRVMIAKKRQWSQDDLFVLNNYYEMFDHAVKVKQNLYQFMLRKVHGCRLMRELMKLCGIRVIAAFHIVAAVGDVKRFSNPKKLVAYLGVAPCIHQSGCREYSVGMQNNGCRGIRSLLVECANAILKSKNASAKHLRDWAVKLKMRKGTNIALCALARKLAVAIWYALNGWLPDIIDNETTLKRKISSLFDEFKLEFIRTLGYNSRKEFVDSFSSAILTQKKGG